MWLKSELYCRLQVFCQISKIAEVRHDYVDKTAEKDLSL